MKATGGSLDEGGAHTPRVAPHRTPRSATIHTITIASRTAHHAQSPSFSQVAAKLPASQFSQRSGDGRSLAAKREVPGRGPVFAAASPNRVRAVSLPSKPQPTTPGTSTIEQARARTLSTTSTRSKTPKATTPSPPSPKKVVRKSLINPTPISAIPSSAQAYPSPTRIALLLARLLPPDVVWLILNLADIPRPLLAARSFRPTSVRARFRRIPNPWGYHSLPDPLSLLSTPPSQQGVALYYLTPPLPPFRGAIHHIALAARLRDNRGDAPATLAASYARWSSTTREGRPAWGAHQSADSDLTRRLFSAPTTSSGSGAAQPIRVRPGRRFDTKGKTFLQMGPSAPRFGVGAGRTEVLRAEKYRVVRPRERAGWDDSVYYGLAPVQQTVKAVLRPRATPSSPPPQTLVADSTPNHDGAASTATSPTRLGTTAPSTIGATLHERIRPPIVHPWINDLRPGDQIAIWAGADAIRSDGGGAGVGEDGRGGWGAESGGVVEVEVRVWAGW